jgi:hypothetical protein
VPAGSFGFEIEGTSSTECRRQIQDCCRTNDSVDVLKKLNDESRLDKKGTSMWTALVDGVAA